MRSYEVFNSDQSGFSFELHAKHTLTERGAKKVEAQVQSVSATSQFYNHANLFGFWLFIVSAFHGLTGKGGNFSPEGHIQCKYIMLSKKISKSKYQAPNVFAVAGRSHIMTRQHMIIWLRDVFFKALPTEQKRALLIVDSWSGWNKTEIDKVKFYIYVPIFMQDQGEKHANVYEYVRKEIPIRNILFLN